MRKNKIKIDLVWELLIFLMYFCLKLSIVMILGKVKSKKNIDDNYYKVKLYRDKFEFKRIFNYIM